MGNLADHNATSVAEKKFWQVFSAKNIIKWYEYRMADPEIAEQEGDMPEALEDKVSKIMDAFNNAKQDSVDSLLKELHATSQEEDETEVDAAMEDEVARIMAQFADAKQNSVDSLFAAANAEEPNTAMEDEVARIMAQFADAKQNSVDSLFAAANAEEAASENAESAPACETQAAGGSETFDPSAVPEGVDPDEVARIMAQFADAKQSSVDSLFATANADANVAANADANVAAEADTGETEKIVVERPEHPSTFDPDFGKLNADTDMNMISGIVNAQQNDIAALFAAQEAAAATEAAATETAPTTEAAAPEAPAANDPNSGLTEPLPADMDPAMAAEVARIMAMFADAKQDSIDSLFQNQ